MTADAIRQARNRYCSVTLTAGVVIGMILTISGFSEVGRGLILGTLFSILNFILIGEMLPFRTGINRNKNIAVSAGSIIFRYALLTLPIVLALKTERFSIFSTVCGLFMIQLIIIIDHLRSITGKLNF